jgi:hypothetical protein
VKSPDYKSLAAASARGARGTEKYINSEAFIC